MFDKAQYDMDFAKKNIRRIALNLNRENDKDILQWLEDQPNMQMAIKVAIRKEMKKQKNKK